MNKTVLISALAAFISMFLLNFLFYALGGITQSYYTEAGEAASRGESGSFAMLLLGHLIMSYFIVVLYRRWAHGEHNFNSGFRYGALLGCAFGLGLNLIWYATADLMTLTGHLVDSAWIIVSTGIVGGVIALVFNRLESTE